MYNVVKKYNIVATGGTFDILHKGHYKLLDVAFESANFHVIIGLTSDEMLAAYNKKKQKTILHNYAKRFTNLNTYLRKTYCGASFEISKLENDFGPAVLSDKVGALVTSEETAHKAKTLNKMRLSKGLKPVDVVVVPMILAYDSNRISSSRIRNSEIDVKGNPTDKFDNSY